MDILFSPVDSVVPVLCVLIFAAVIIGFLVMAVNGIGTWNKNNHSPRLSVEAEVVGKRVNVSHHTCANAGDISGAHGYSSTEFTTYYVTFQVASGDRMEFSVSGEEYGQLAERDVGSLTFQGTRYLAFDRKF